ncbi:transposon integrase, partial [Prevotella dentalis DSM 3688]
MYIYAQPQTAAEKEYNRQIMEKAETIRIQVYLEVLNERYGFFSKDKMKESFLPYFEEQLRKTNTKSLSS